MYLVFSITDADVENQKGALELRDHQVKTQGFFLSEYWLCSAKAPEINLTGTKRPKQPLLFLVFHILYWIKICNRQGTRAAGSYCYIPKTITVPHPCRYPHPSSASCMSFSPCSSPPLPRSQAKGTSHRAWHSVEGLRHQSHSWNSNNKIPVMSRHRWQPPFFPRKHIQDNLFLETASSIRIGKQVLTTETPSRGMDSESSVF